MEPRTPASRPAGRCAGGGALSAANGCGPGGNAGELAEKKGGWGCRWGLSGGCLLSGVWAVLPGAVSAVVEGAGCLCPWGLVSAGAVSVFAEAWLLSGPGGRVVWPGTGGCGRLWTARCCLVSRPGRSGAGRFSRASSFSGYRRGHSLSRAFQGGGAVLGDVSATSSPCSTGGLSLPRWGCAGGSGVRIAAALGQLGTSVACSGTGSPAGVQGPAGAVWRCAGMPLTCWGATGVPGHLGGPPGALGRAGVGLASGGLVRAVGGAAAGGAGRCCAWRSKRGRRYQPLLSSRARGGRALRAQDGVVLLAGALDGPGRR